MEGSDRPDAGLGADRASVERTAVGRTSMERMAVSKRVHVMPVGYENDRIVLAAERLAADRVILLEDAARDRLADGSSVGTAGGTSAGPAYGPIVRERLDDRGIPHETVSCDLFDLYDSIGTIAEVATAFADEDVAVNLASGSKVTAIGGMIACMATGATPYYVRAERYGEATDGVSEGIADIYELPTYPIDRPSREQVAVLARVADAEPISKKRLIAFGEERGLPFLADYDGDGEKGKYRRLERHVLAPLESREYVTVADVGRRKRVSLTDRGRNTLRAFSYLLDETP